MDKVMIIDSGARGHALALVHLKSGAKEVLVAPGNEGIERNIINGKGEELPIKIDKKVSLKNPITILKSARDYRPDFVEVAQDDALALGIVDLLQKEGIDTFGPSQKAAEIESSKVFSKEFMNRNGIATSRFKTFQRGDNSAIIFARDLLENCSEVFFKADGLYEGKGVVSAKDKTSIVEAYEKISGMGNAAKKFLVEEGLEGEEFSWYVLSNINGKNYVAFNSSQDNKRVWNRDKGANTGGMASNSPALVTKGLENRIDEEIIKPTLEGLAREDRPFVGVLYLGGIYNKKDKSIKVIEFNSRWGDPECQVILPGISNYHSIVYSALIGDLRNGSIEGDGLTRMCIVGASAGYPGKYEKGKKIWINYDDLPEGVNLLSAGIKVEDEQLYTDGGRVFNVVAAGKDIIEARRIALQVMACCDIEDNGLHYRTDGGWRDVQRIRENLD